MRYGIERQKDEIEFLISQVGTPSGVKKVITGFPIMIDKIPTLLILELLKIFALDNNDLGEMSLPICGS